MKNSLYTKMSTAITVLALLSILMGRSSSAPFVAKVFGLIFITLAFVALIVVGLKRSTNDKEVREKFVKAMTLIVPTFFIALTIVGLKSLKPESFPESYIYISAAIFFVSLLTSSIMLGLVQATINNRNAN